jgi:hypothetical protein
MSWTGRKKLGWIARNSFALDRRSGGFFQSSCFSQGGLAEAIERFPRVKHSGQSGSRRSSRNRSICVRAAAEYFPAQTDPGFLSVPGIRCYAFAAEYMLQDLLGRGLRKLRENADEARHHEIRQARDKKFG